MKNKKIKEIVLSVFSYVAIFIIVIITFNVGLYFACLIDSSTLEKNVHESYDILRKQGMFYRLSSFFDIINDNCTDTVIINELYSVDNKEPYVSYMKARKNYKEGLTTYELEDMTGEGVTVNYFEDSNYETYESSYNPISELGSFLNGKIHYSLNYGRYWHGYLILFRPLLMLFNISQIRLLMFVTFLSLFIYFIYLVKNRFGKNIALVFALSLIFSGYFSASFSLESSSVFLVMMISAILLIKRIDNIKNFSVYLFVVGCITNFADYLTVPLITLGMLCGLYFLKAIDDGKDWKWCLKSLICNSIIWMFGYSATWIFKWLLYDLTIGGNESMFSIGFTQSFYRMQRVNVNVSNNYIDTIYNIITKSSFGILITLFVLIFINKFKLQSQQFDKSTMVFLLLALMPIGWYIALANHTVMHYYFTYRQSFVFSLGSLLFLSKMFSKKGKNKI